MSRLEGWETGHDDAAPHERDARAARRVPERLRGRGDLTLVVGLGGDADAAARLLAASAGAEVPVLPVPDRRAALAARADGVRTDRPVVGVVTLPGPLAVAEFAVDLAGIEPDQVWAAVDASRKDEDTAAWVAAVDAVLAVDAIAASNAALTATPLAIDRLGHPVLWLDAPPAAPVDRRIG